MNNAILSDINEVLLLKKEVSLKQKEVNKKALEVKKNFELFLADQTISLEERFAIWIQAPTEMYTEENLEGLKHEVAKSIDFWMCALAAMGMGFDEKINIPYELEYRFWSKNLNKFNDSDFIFDGFENDNITQVVYEMINYLVSNNIGATWQWQEN